MEHIDTLITARWVIPVEPAKRVFDHAAVAVRQGRIIDVLPIEQARVRYLPDELVERPHHVLLPGFVNAHTRSAMCLLRGAVQGADLEDWRARIAALERRWIDADYVGDGATTAIAEMLGCGITCFGDAHLFPEIIAQTAAEQRIRVCIGLPVLERPTVWAGSADECFEKGLKLHDEYRDDPLITTALTSQAHWSLSDETLARLRRNADELEIPMILALNETAAEAQVSGERAIGRLGRLGLLSPLLTAVHLVHSSNEDLAQLAGSGASVVHCPRRNLRLGAGLCRAMDLLDRGVEVAFGSASPAANDNMDMLEELRIGALLARGFAPGEVSADAHTWLRAATLGGARALGMSEVIGSLTPGKWADLCCIDLRRPQTCPVHDVAAQIVFAASRDQIADAWVAGRALLREGALTHLDLEQALERAQAWGERIRGSMSS